VDWGEGIWDKVAVIVIVIIVVSTALAFFVFQDEDDSSGPLVLSAGDFLHYSISGEENNTTIASSNIYNYYGAGSSSIGQNEYMDVVGFTPQASDPYGTDSLVAVELIETPFGQKCVRTLMRYSEGEGSNNSDSNRFLVITCAGYDSLIIYREIVVRPGLHYAITLTETNNTEIPKADSVVHSESVVGKVKITNEPSRYGGSDDGPAFTAYGLNSMEVLDGQRIRYDMSGEPIKMYFMSLNDIAHMEDGGAFSYIDWISLDDRMGEVNSTVAPGTYWWITDAAGGPNEATLTFYWTP
jgi:hypothetical protein